MLNKEQFTNIFNRVWEANGMRRQNLENNVPCVILDYWGSSPSLTVTIYENEKAVVGELVTHFSCSFRFDSSDNPYEECMKALEELCKNEKIRAINEREAQVEGLRLLLAQTRMALKEFGSVYTDDEWKEILREAIK